MPFEPDYRADKMDSREGQGRARERWLRWYDSVSDDVREAAFGGTISRSDLESDLGVERAAAFWKGVAAEARERSELVGFWIAWHQAGGFAALEGSGWNRATIFRKVRRFRAVYEAHPDEYDFPWITLDLHTAWQRDLIAALELDRSAGSGF